MSTRLKQRWSNTKVVKYSRRPNIYVLFWTDPCGVTRGFKNTSDPEVSVAALYLSSSLPYRFFHSPESASRRSSRLSRVRLARLGSDVRAAPAVWMNQAVCVTHSKRTHEPELTRDYFTRITTGVRTVKGHYPGRKNSLRTSEILRPPRVGACARFIGLDENDAKCGCVARRECGEGSAGHPRSATAT